MVDLFWFGLGVGLVLCFGFELGGVWLGCLGLGVWFVDVWGFGWGLLFCLGFRIGWFGCFGCICGL